MMREAHPDRRLRRSILALLSGLLTIVVLSVATDAAMHASGIFPPEGQAMSDSRWLLATAYRIIYGCAGCYLAARLAPDRPLRHALALGAVGLAASALGLLATWGGGPEFGPAWYSVAVVGMSLPCGWVGGKIRELRSMRSAA